MPTPTSVDLVQDLQSLAPSAIMAFYELDATALGEDSILYFHNGTNGYNDSIVWNGNTYSRLPISITGFEFLGEGRPPRPAMRIANLGGWVSALLLATDDLVGAKVTRRRTLARYVIGEYAGNVELPQDVFFVDHKIAETGDIVELELVSSLDLDGVKFPNRLVTSQYCSWRHYRGVGCQFGEPFLYFKQTGEYGPGIASLTGSWLLGRTYTAGQTVVRDNTIWEALQTSLNIEPVEGSYWTAKQVYRGLWDSGNTYSAYDTVLYTVNSRPIISMAKATVSDGTIPTDSTVWELDVCPKTFDACVRHFDPDNQNKALRYGGFPGTGRMPDKLS